MGITNNLSLASQELDDSFGETEDVVGDIDMSISERPVVNEPLNIERRKTVQRSAIKENRKQYQDRSFSGELRLSTRKSMENLEINLDIEKEQPCSEEEPIEIITRKSTRKTSKSYDEDDHKAILPFVRTYSISSNIHILKWKALHLLQHQLYTHL